MPPPNTIQAAVFVNSNNDAVIFPPVIITAKNETVDILNTTGDDIFVIYPADVFEGSGGAIDPNKTIVPVADKGKNSRKVHGNTRHGRIPFKIFSAKTNSAVK